MISNFISVKLMNDSYKCNWKINIQLSTLVFLNFINNITFAYNTMSLSAYSHFRELDVFRILLRGTDINNLLYELRKFVREHKKDYALQCSLIHMLQEACKSMSSISDDVVRFILVCRLSCSLSFIL